MKKVVILGAGFTGLSAAWRLSESGADVVCVEKDSLTGGLAKTIYRKGCFCDIGPHRFFTDDHKLLDEVKALLEPDSLEEKTRVSKIWVNKRYINYPPDPKDILFSFSAPFLFRIASDYFTTRIKKRFHRLSDDSFKDYVKNRCGETLYNIYFKDYTNKVWGIPPQELSPELGKMRVPDLSLPRLVKELFTSGRGSSRSSVRNFFYPSGGIGKIASKLSERIARAGGKIFLKTEVKRINIEAGKIKSVTVVNDANEPAEIPADFVISTLPVTELATMSFKDRNILMMAQNLKFRSIVYLFLIIAKPRASRNQWIYYPEEKYTFNRISEIKNWIQDMCPADRTVLCIEITCDPKDHVWGMEARDIFSRIKKELYRSRLITEDDGILDIFKHREQFAYPIYDKGFEDSLRNIFSPLLTIDNLITTGRQGLFKYSDIDYCIGMGFSAARRFLDKK